MNPIYQLLLDLNSICSIKKIKNNIYMLWRSQHSQSKPVLVCDPLVFIGQFLNSKLFLKISKS